jgi:hypothetical protein
MNLLLNYIKTFIESMNQKISSNELFGRMNKELNEIKIKVKKQLLRNLV